MFGRGQDAVDPLNNDVYVVTGNGPWNGKADWGDSVLKLSRDGSKLIDAFTPTNQAYLNNTDSDLGSTGPDILVPVKIKHRTWHLLVQGGKGSYTSAGGSAVLWLINRDRMGSHAGPGSLGGQLQHIQSPGGCEVLMAPAVWKDSKGHVYAIYANSCGMASYKVVTSGHKPRLVVFWHRSGSFTTPIIVSGTLYVAENGAVLALNPANDRQKWSSANGSAGGTIGGIHWEYPTVSGRLLVMTDENGRLYAYKRG